MSTAPITELAQRIATSNPKDIDQQERILRDLNLQKEEFEREGAGLEATRYLGAAAMLTSYLTRMGQVGGDEVISVISRLVEIASRTLAWEERKGEIVGEAQDLKSQEAGMESVHLIGDMMLGEVLVKLGHIDEEQIHAALKEQRATGIRFGEALMRIGAVDWQQLEAGLNYQDNCRQVVENFAGRKPVTKKDISQKAETVRSLEANGLRLISDVLLGEILIDDGRLTKDQVIGALEVQRATGLRIGEVLVQIGACDWDDVQYGVQVQGQIRRYA